MVQRFLDFIKKEDLFLPSDKILIGVSAGIDSVVLCYLFYQAKLNFGIAHCNFNLRGSESDGDELFVKNIAEKYGLNFYSKSFDTTQYSKAKGISIQMAARELRYSWFEEIRTKEQYQFIATAHHQNDVVETVLINLIKGTGIAGMHGIQPKNVKVIRPLLFATKEDIEGFAKEHKLKFREDSSNLSDKYLRNKIRNQVIPILKEINPSLEKTFTENVERIKWIEEYYNSKVDVVERDSNLNNDGNLKISLNKIGEGNEITPAILHGLLVRYNFNHDVINEIIYASENPVSGKQFLSPSHRIIVDREFLILVNLESSKEDEPYFINKNTELYTASFEGNSFSIIVDNRNSVDAIGNNFKAGLLYLDEANLQYPLTIRRWKPGDFFYPLGMQKKKKISDFLIDNKVPLNKKEKTFVIVSGDDVVCVLGHRIDNRYRINPSTKKVLAIDYKEK